MAGVVLWPVGRKDRAVVAKHLAIKDLANLRKRHNKSRKEQRTCNVSTIVKMPGEQKRHD
jgi:hypothetical protein